ncbi:olfactory receptor 6N2-like [Discoglossus pictus]
MLKVRWNNQSDFLLLGFSFVNGMEMLPFIIILTVYILTITANLFIIIIVRIEPSLHKPMYYFIGAFSFLEICYTAVTVPRLLRSLITKQKTISSAGCLAQFYFHFSLGSVENFSLSIMAYDRYVAICNPLRYSIIMSTKTCNMFLLGSWTGGFLAMTVPCLQLSSLQFCGHNEIDHYYCDFVPLFQISCSETSQIEKLFFVIAYFIIMGCFLLIMVSYVSIIRTTMKISTLSGRHKAFSTCASHLTVVLLFYGSIIFMFLLPKASHSFNLNKIISIFPSIVIPLLNPIIYTLRNHEVKEAVKKTMQKMMECQRL